MAHYCAGHEPPSPGTHVFHAVAFHQGTASHGSAATTVLGGDIGAVTDRLAAPDSLLAATSGEPGRLCGEIGEFGSVLEGAASRVDESTGAMREPVTAIEGASLRLDALFFPHRGTSRVHRRAPDCDTGQVEVSGIRPKKGPPAHGASWLPGRPCQLNEFSAKSPPSSWASWLPGLLPARLRGGQGAGVTVPQNPHKG